MALAHAMVESDAEVVVIVGASLEWFASFLADPPGDPNS